MIMIIHVLLNISGKDNVFILISEENILNENADCKFS